MTSENTSDVLNTHLGDNVNESTRNVDASVYADVGRTSDLGQDEYLVKTIQWKDNPVRIITQNKNGPCPLVAICNVLFLKEDLVILPPDREVVSFEYLMGRMGDYLLNHEPTDTGSTENKERCASEGEESSKADTVECINKGENCINTDNENIVDEGEQGSKEPRFALKREETSEIVLTYRHNLDKALSILPHLQAGLDVNVRFDSIHGFEATEELAMFDLFHVDLVHGWIVDPQDVGTYDVMVNKCGTYNQAVECIVSSNELNTQPVDTCTLEEEQKLHEGFVATEFLRETATQLTYYGLELLLDSIPLDSLCVLFRNNHFSTIYRHPSLGLFMLVTDSGLVSQQSVVWESLGDVDQSSSEFFSGTFSKADIKETINMEEEYVNTELE
ncbi:hypothetical protein BDB01DRAFT_846767 [Pilobolus umbonatus]|nr:hypothetical protein BDB01DRAFT_846767 [Pilobolus umbonatus]